MTKLFGLLGLLCIISLPPLWAAESNDEQSKRTINYGVKFCPYGRITPLTKADTETLHEDLVDEDASQILISKLGELTEQRGQIEFFEYLRSLPMTANTPESMPIGAIAEFFYQATLQFIDSIENEQLGNQAESIFSNFIYEKTRPQATEFQNIFNCGLFFSNLSI